MQLMIKFDIDADIIEVPQVIVEQKDVLRKKFLKWLYNKHNHHRYWTLFTDSSGKQFVGLQYRGDAFVEWLNKKELSKTDELAYVVEQQVDIDTYPTDFPAISF